MHSTQYRHGFPSWIGFNDVVTEGELPPLPDADKASTGLQFQAMNFAVACLILVAVSVALLSPICSANISATLVVPLFIAAALVGVFMPADTTCLAWGGSAGVRLWDLCRSPRHSNLRISNRDYRSIFDILVGLSNRNCRARLQIRQAHS